MNIRNFSICITILLISFGCAIPSETAIKNYNERKMSEYRVRNKQIALAMGKRKLDFPPNQVIKAIIVAASDNNMTVVNLDKDLGFMLIEGHGFLSDEEGMKICNEVVKRQNLELPDGWEQSCAGNNADIKLTGSVDSKDGRSSLVKIGLSTSNTATIRGLDDSVIGEYNDQMPEKVQREYELFWQALDRALFVQENTQ